MWLSGEAREVRSALEWAQVKAMAADGVSQRQIALRLGINRRTVRRLLEAEGPPRYHRGPVGSKLDRFEPILGRVLEEWPQVKGAAYDRDPARAWV